MKARLKDNCPVKVSSVELKQLQTLRSVVRQGRVAALHLDTVEFQNGTSLPRYSSKLLPSSVLTSQGFTSYVLKP